jgi:uncharacterized protein
MSGTFTLGSDLAAGLDGRPGPMRSLVLVAGAVRNDGGTRMTTDPGGVRETAASYGLQPDPAVLADLVERIVRAVAPDRIILFGSAAEGRMGPNSDLDVLVVKSGDYRRIDMMHAIRRELRGLGAAVDLVITTPTELEAHGDRPGLVYRPALRQGREVYAA